VRVRDRRSSQWLVEDGRPAAANCERKTLIPRMLPGSGHLWEKSCKAPHSWKLETMQSWICVVVAWPSFQRLWISMNCLSRCPGLFPGPLSHTRQLHKLLIRQPIFVILDAGVEICFAVFASPPARTPKHASHGSSPQNPLQLLNLTGRVSKLTC
jgi:hypothetical protein